MNPLSVVREKAAHAPGSPEWIAERRTYIGGSDAAAIAGLNPYASEYQVWMEKTGEREPDDISDKAPVEWGNRLEPVVAEAYAQKTGKRIARVNNVIRHRDFPFIAANVDRRIVGEPRGLEIKTAGAWAANADLWGPAGTDQVPPAYLMQCAHYMAVTGYDAWDLAVLIGGQDFRIYTLHRDLELEASLIAIERAFWRHVETKTPPPYKTTSDVLLRFPRSFDVVCEATPAVVAAVGDIENLKATIADCEREIEDRKVVVTAHMGEADTLMFDGAKICTWKSNARGVRSFVIPKAK